MNRYDDTMDQIKQYAEEFMERKYPDEASYFNIAWDSFTEVLQDRGDAVELKGPALRGIERLVEDDIVMAPIVIRAFHILFTMIQMESENSEILRQEMLQLLSQNKFSLEFSMEIVAFFMEKEGY
ncbi:MAG: hypothetical protein PVF58_16015 [Candidatus Methanofastidiosia archaeon]